MLAFRKDFPGEGVLRDGLVELVKVRSGTYIWDMMPANHKPLKRQLQRLFSFREGKKKPPHDRPGSCGGNRSGAPDCDS